MERVLILMSTYNAGIFLEEQLNSLLNQKGCDIDILIRDDGSSDKTVDYLKSISEKNDRVQLIIGEENLKPAKSFMTLLHKSGNYDYYAFADQDDIWDQNKLETAVEKLSHVDVPALYCSNARIVDGDGKEVGREVYTNKNKAVDFYTVASVGNFLGCGMVMNRELRDAIIEGGMPDNIIMHDSYVASVCVSVGGQLIYDSNPHFSYRVHSSNSVGVAVGKKASLRRFIKKTGTDRKISVTKQNDEIVKRYPLEPSKKKFLMKTIHYKDNIFRRIGMSADTRIHFDSLHASIATRLAFLLGNI